MRPSRESAPAVHVRLPTSETAKPRNLAEGVRFELTEPFGSPVFKTETPVTHPNLGSASEEKIRANLTRKLRDKRQLERG